MEWLTLAAAKVFLGKSWAFLNAIPWKVWRTLLYFALVLAAMMYAHHTGKATGLAKGLKERDRLQEAWDQSVERGKRELARQKAIRDNITVKTETIYVDRIRVVREKGSTLIQRIPALVPDDACLLPAGWRLSHDHAAAGTVPPAANGTDATSGNAEAIAWRPWNTRPGTSGSADGGRELRSLPRGGRAVAGATGVDSGAAIR